MNKVTYMIKRIAGMNYGNFFKTIDKVCKITGKNKVSTFFDCVTCGLAYGAGYVDYYQFHMYDMNRAERKTIITRGVNNSIIKKYNDKASVYKFEDKCVFNELFADYMNRDWMKLNENNFEEFSKMLDKHSQIVVKPVDSFCGKGVEKLDVTNEDRKALFDRLLANKQLLVEEVAIQHEVIANIYPLSINTIRVVTLNHHVVAAFLRIGNDGNVVDNFNHGGMVTVVDINDGIVKYKAIDKATREFDVHPYTNAPIVGVKIPMWDEIVAMCEAATQIIPEVLYVGWDVCVGKEKPFLIEGNDFPGHDVYQLPVHRSDNYGLLPTFKKAMES